MSEAKVLIVLIAFDSFDSLDRYHSFPPFLVQEAPIITELPTFTYTYNYTYTYTTKRNKLYTIM